MDAGLRRVGEKPAPGGSRLLAHPRAPRELTTAESAPAACLQS